MNDQDVVRGAAPGQQLVLQERQLDPSLYQLLSLIRLHIQQEIGGAVGAQTRVPEELRLCKRSTEVRVELPATRNPAVAMQLACLFTDMGQDPEVYRRFRTGELSMQTEGGAWQRAACVLEVLSVDEEGLAQDWWLSYRHFGLRPKGGGRLFEHWLELQGTGWEELPEPFQAWVLEDTSARDSMDSESLAMAVPRPSVRVTFPPMPGPQPRTGWQHALTAVRVVQDLFTAGALRCHAVVVFYGRTVERWEVNGGTEDSIDDIARIIAAYSAPHAVVVLRRAAVVDRGSGHATAGQALWVDVELRGRGTRLAWPADPRTGEVDWEPMTIEDLGTLDERGWIKVSPSTHIEFEWPGTQGAGGGQARGA